MALNDPLANALSLILNGEKSVKKEVIIHPSSKIIRKVLDIMKENMFIGDIEELSKSKGGILKVNLISSINKCNVIKPRYAVTKEDYEKFEKRYLPAKDFGLIIVSTNSGIMTHIEAKKKGIGGRFLAYCY